ncbi:Uncharacterized protein Rs2_21507 [Raphanus sativus]|nr:Uncharacterized protein Rs2_21507 [Raphanus sativus]
MRSSFLMRHVPPYIADHYLFFTSSTCSPSLPLALQVFPIHIRVLVVKEETKLRKSCCRSCRDGNIVDRHHNHQRHLSHPPSLVTTSTTIASQIRLRRSPSSTESRPPLSEALSLTTYSRFESWNLYHLNCVYICFQSFYSEEARRSQNHSFPPSLPNLRTMTYTPHFQATYEKVIDDEAVKAAVLVLNKR